MDPTGVVGETGKQVGMFMRIMEHQPLSLALVVMNFVLLGFLFYSGSVQLKQRTETTAAVMQWQKEADILMSACVSSDIMKMVLSALERDRETYRNMIQQPRDNPLPLVPPTPKE